MALKHCLLTATSLTSALLGYDMTLIALRYHSLEMHPIENKETNVICLPIVSTSVPLSLHLS